jgi:hypothetical protein
VYWLYGLSVPGDPKVVGNSMKSVVVPRTAVKLALEPLTMAVLFEFTFWSVALSVPSKALIDILESAESIQVSVSAFRSAALNRDVRPETPPKVFVAAFAELFEVGAKMSAPSNKDITDNLETLFDNFRVGFISISLQCCR